jgi:HSP20 family protein
MANNTLTRYQPTGVTRLPDMIDRLFQESFVLPSMFDRAFNGSTSPSFPVNLIETADSYVMQAGLPGLKTDDLDIQVVGREVAIKGTSESWLPEGGSWVWRGLPNGQFYETYTLPVDVESDSTQASYENGILTITLPKAAHLRPKNIKVEVKK